MVIFMLTLLNLLSSVSAEHWEYGPTWGYRNYKASGYIVSMETTLRPGPPPNPTAPRLALWPGMDTMQGLVQPIIVSSPEYLGSKCGGATKDTWCVFASMVVGNVAQKSGKYVPLKADEALVMKFKYNEGLDGFEQWLYINNKMVSNLTAKSGKSNSFYIDTECQGSHKGIVSNHTYSDTTIVLSTQNPTWGKSPTNHYMACADSATSPDGGKTWKIPHIWVRKSEARKDYKPGGKTTDGPGSSGFCPEGPGW